MQRLFPGKRIHGPSEKLLCTYGLVLDPPPPSPPIYGFTLDGTGLDWTYWIVTGVDAVDSIGIGMGAGFDWKGYGHWTGLGTGLDSTGLPAGIMMHWPRTNWTGMPGPAGPWIRLE